MFQSWQSVKVTLETSADNGRAGRVTSATDYDDAQGARVVDVLLDGDLLSKTIPTVAVVALG